jgi:hypothetical protein
MREPVENLEAPDPTPIPTPLEAALYPDSCAAWLVSVTPGSATAKVWRCSTRAACFRQRGSARQ